MNSKNIHFALQAELENEIDPAQIKLWPSIRQRLAMRKRSLFQQGDFLMKPNFARKFTLGHTALTVLAVVAVFALLLASPQGRAFAESLLQFFTRAQSDSLPSQAVDTYPEPPRDKSLVDAEQLAGFSVLTPSTLPEGLNFYGASYDEKLKAVVQQFGFTPEDIRLSLRQQPFTTPEACSLCGLIGASAPLDAVSVADVPGEYLEGVWELTDNGPVWRNDPYLKTLRWQKDGMAFELIYMGTELEKNALIALAESIN